MPENTAIPPNKIRLDDIVKAMRTVDTRVILVSPRVLQRIIRFERRLSTLELSVPHSKSYFTTRDRLLDFTSRFEYHLNIERATTDEVILLAQPEDDELDKQSLPELLFDYWRLLFHIRVHLALRDAAAEGRFDNTQLMKHLTQLGAIEFAEARNVFAYEEMLMPPISIQSVYIEFAATFLELWYFAPQDLRWYFPALNDFEPVARRLGALVDHEDLHRACRIEGSAELEDLATDEDRWLERTNRSQITSDRSEQVDLKMLRRLESRANRMTKIGNLAKSAILRQKAVRFAPPGLTDDSLAKAKTALTQFAERLCRVLELNDPEESEQWAAALQPLLAKAEAGFRTIESRLLYDLQRVCSESERGVFSVDLIRWTLTRGATSLKRPLPLLREVLAARRLQSALEKLRFARITAQQSQQISTLLSHAVDHSHDQLRKRVKPILETVFESEGCLPRNIPERVALNKIIDELLDRIVYRAHLSMGHLRDTISRNNLKLNDLQRLGELFTGDLLLRIDRRLATELDGLYHRGPIYLRASHRLSSMAFGTRLGRVVSRYVALPFGGAFLLLESIRHLIHFLAPHSDAAGAHAADHTAAATVDTAVAPTSATEALPSLQFAAAIFVLGLFFLLLIESSGFRSWCFHQFVRLGRLLLYLFRDLPGELVRMPVINRILESDAYRTVLNYAVKPLVLTGGGLLLIDRIAHWLPERQIAAVPFQFSVWSTNLFIIVFLAVNLFLNSPLGRYADAMITDQLRRSWRELQIRVFSAILHFVIDLFEWVLKTIEQIIYTVDELLRFRSGENFLVLMFKAVAGVFWTVISYIVRFYVTLLIEPQINPIKHFPVVTVSHKMILPFSIPLAQLMAAPLEPITGVIIAGTIAGTTVFLLPGVFGFLAWELKENWRLYASNRARNLRSIPLGSHGESMSRLLRRGFHSGTLPKLYHKLRKSSRRAVQSGKWKSVRKHKQALHHIEHSVDAFIERELFGLLKQLPGWKYVDLVVSDVRVASNELEFFIERLGSDQAAFRIIFQEHGGWLIARQKDPGWTAQLDEMRQREWSTALSGVFKYAGVDLIWDELLAGLDVVPVFYDFNRDGLLAWTEHDVHSTVQFKLRDNGATASLTPSPKFITEPRKGDLDRWVFSRRSISWQKWIETWENLGIDRDAGHRIEGAEAGKAAG